MIEKDNIGKGCKLTVFKTTSNMTSKLHEKSKSSFYRYDINVLTELNKLIHSHTRRCERHLKHIELTASYASKIADRLSVPLDRYKLKYAALAHDLLKEKEFTKEVNQIDKGGFEIPQDLNWYVRSNLLILEKYGLDYYFNTDIQLHALASGIYLHKHMGITDPEILYPVFFHSCPIIPVYETLNPCTQTTVDIIMISDKLSSNEINRSSRKSSINLELAVFGENGDEFNYSLGLLLARLIGQGKSTEKQSIMSTDFYYKRLLKTHPYVSGKSLEEMKTWARK
jgi:HD superfamily phosphohydrolase YqeK